jgi:hypothetical protein
MLSSDWFFPISKLRDAFENGYRGTFLAGPVGTVTTLPANLGGDSKWWPALKASIGVSNAAFRSARAAASLALRSDPAVQPPSFTPRRLAAARPALVRCEMSARSFCASAANRWRTKGSTSTPSSVTTNGTRWTIKPEIRCTSRESQSSLAR